MVLTDIYLFIVVFPGPPSNETSSDSHKDQTDSGTMSGKKHEERDPVSGERIDSIIVSGHLCLCVQFVS